MNKNKKIKTRNRKTASGFKGIHKTDNNKWRARLDFTIKNKVITISLGSYNTIEEAVKVRRNYLLNLM